MIILEPKVKSKIIPINHCRWPVLDTVHFKPNAAIEHKNFEAILSSRTSRRDMQPIEISELGQFFYLANRTKSVGTNSFGQRIEKRNTPSAGGLHTIECLISPMGDNHWYRYNSVTHCLDSINIKVDELALFKQECSSFFPDASNACLLWYVCDIERLSGKYESPESLALRESGSISAIHALVAESLNFAYCPLGALGFKEANGLLNERELAGVGTAVIGHHSRR